MKRRILALAIALLLLAAPALGERVFDGADIFTSSEEAEIQAMIDDIADKYSFDVGVVSTDDSLGKSAALYAADFFEEAGMGYGAEGDGILFAFCFDIGDYFIDTHGWGITAFTDAGLDVIHSNIRASLDAHDYPEAMRIFLGMIPSYLDQALTGEPYDVLTADVMSADYDPNPWSRAGDLAIVYILIGLVAALIIVCIMRAGLKRAKHQSAAGDYVTGVDLTRANDFFLYRTVTRRKIETSSSGGSSTHSSSSGGTHGGSGGKL